MPDCHLCEENGKPTSRCLSCKGPSPHQSNKGLRFVSLEHLPPKELAKLKVPDPEPENPMADFFRFGFGCPPNSVICSQNTSPYHRGPVPLLPDIQTFPANLFTSDCLKPPAISGASRSYSPALERPKETFKDI